MAVITNVISGTYGGTYSGLFLFISVPCLFWAIYSSARAQRGEALTSIVFRFFQRCRMGLQWVFDGPQLINKLCEKHGRGASFKISTPIHDILFISNPSLMDEVNSASHKQLSLHAIAKDVLQPQVTIPSFIWDDKRRGAVGSGYVRALRSLLTSHLPQFQPRFEEMLQELLRDEMATSKTDSEGWSQVQLPSMVRRVMVSTTSLVFFGEGLTQDAEFRKALLDFPVSSLATAELIQFAPTFLHSAIAYGVTRGRWAEKVIFGRLTPIVEERLRIRANSKREQPSDAPADCVQWVIQMIPSEENWDASRVIGQVMSLWVAALFQPVILCTNLIKDIAVHPEYVQPLREEIRDVWRNDINRDVEKLPLLDSFTRESSRCGSAEAITGRRRALEPCQLSDGSHLSVGDWLCIPQRNMMQDPYRYRNPDLFNGFRFLEANRVLRAGGSTADVPDKKETSFTDASWEWPIWGFGHLTCPGRWYASLVMKLTAIAILENYDITPVDESIHKTMVWRSSIVPRPDITCKIRPI